MKNFIEFIVQRLVDNPDKVNVEEVINDKKHLELKIEVAKNDIGKVIGKHGKNINALRTLFTAVGAKNKKRALIQVIE